MTAIRYKYLVRDTAKSGQVRYYVRRAGFPKIRINGEPGSAPFMRAYHDAIAAMEGQPVALPSARSVRTVRKDSFEWLVNLYYQSPVFQGHAPSTQNKRRGILRRICEEHGHRSKDIPQAAIRAGRDKRGATPAAANNYLKALKAVFRWAVDQHLVETNPVLGVEHLKLHNQIGHHTWTAAECAQFEAAHALGTMPRMAYALAYYTGARRSDLVTLGRQHITGNVIAWDQVKSGQKRARRVVLPVLPELRAAIDAMPTTPALHFIHTVFDKPFSAKSFGGKFKDWTTAANLPDHCTLHGLRKALGMRLAEGGATENEIAAVLGHADTSTAKIYTRAASQVRLAQAGMRTIQTQSVPASTASGDPLGQFGEK